MDATCIAVLGAGTMGTGIALVLAAAGHQVLLFDTRQQAAAEAPNTIAEILSRKVAKGSLDAVESKAILGRISVVTALSEITKAETVIEAVVEDAALKKELFSALDAQQSASCILASNTSSLSLTTLAATCTRPERVVGIHFFNPAPVMPLVEIVSALQTSAETVAKAKVLVQGCGKTVVSVKDTPGFIVNRIARPFYGEALRILDEQLADVATIDWAMRQLGGFRMGPFELMDLIGIDVNYAVTLNIFQASYYDPRYRPSISQQRLVEAGRLGKKSGRGFYDYTSQSAAPLPVKDAWLGNEIMLRIVCMLINEAYEAAHYGIASKDDIECAMTLGVNYPKGLFAWAQELGEEEVVRRLLTLYEKYREDRYRPSVGLLQKGTP